MKGSVQAHTIALILRKDLGMFAAQTCNMKEQIAQSQELQKLLGIRTQKLTELLAVEQQIERVAKGYQSMANAENNNQPNPSTVVREEEAESDIDDVEKTPIANDEEEIQVVSKGGRRGRPSKAEGLAQDQSLSALIITCLGGKKMGEKLDAITTYCLKSGYQSSAKDFSQVVRQTLYNLRAKKVVIEDRESRRFVLN